MPPTVLCGRYYYPCLTDGEMEAQPGEAPCSGNICDRTPEEAHEASHSISLPRACVLGYHETPCRDWDGSLVFPFITQLGPRLECIF